MYNYTNPLMQKVAKLCEDGHWPICKNEEGYIAVFTPITVGEGCIRRSDWGETKEIAKHLIGETYQSDREPQPTEIIGFYHPPTPKFKVGDKVRVREDLASLQLEKNQDYNKYFLTSAGKSGVITKINSFNLIEIELALGGINEELTVDMLEPMLEPIIVEMTVSEIEEKLGVKNLKIVK